MGIKRGGWIVYCDARCGATLDVGNCEGQLAAAVEAKQEGWTGEWDGKMYCPECSQTREEEDPLC